MEIFSQTQSIALLDGLSCALLAAAASAKAKKNGSHFTGAAILGFICGICGPLVRETILHGAAGTQVIVKLLPDEAFLGSLAGIAVIRIARSLPASFWLDALSVSLASVLGCLLALQELGIVAALCLGLISGFLPGILRDISLGDIAEIVESSWYATAAVFGCVAGICIFVTPFLIDALAIMENRLMEISIIFGAAISFIFQILKRKNL